MHNLKTHPIFKEKLKNKRGLHKITKLTHINTKFQRGVVEMILDLFNGLSHPVYVIFLYINATQIHLSIIDIKLALLFILYVCKYYSY